MVTGCRTKILLLLWSSWSPTAIYLYSDILLLYLYQHFLLSLLANRKLFQDILQRMNVRTFLDTITCQSWCSGNTWVALALQLVFHLLLQCLVLSPPCFWVTSVFSLFANSLQFQSETEILFEGMKCLHIQLNSVYRGMWPQSSQFSSQLPYGDMPCKLYEICLSISNWLTVYCFYKWQYICFCCFCYSFVNNLS